MRRDGIFVDFSTFEPVNGLRLLFSIVDREDSLY